MKVVINACHGGFGLSEAAFEKFLDRKGIAWEKQHRVDYDLHEYYHAGHLGDEKHFSYSQEIVEDRSDPDLIAVVEEMGEGANGEYARLKVVEIPDYVDWYIEEYDGLEWVAEAHRTWD